MTPDPAREEVEALAVLAATGADLDYIGGNCPVQAEGKVDGQPFYFRARGDAWEIWIGASDDWWTDRGWSVQRSYGVWPDAGWMPYHEAVGFIVEGIAGYRQHLTTGGGGTDG